MKKQEKSVDLGGRKLTLSMGHFAQRATSAVMATYGETVVMATVVAAPLKNDLGYFPLQVEYKKRLFAGGRIKGSRWVKREGRPTDEDILTARLIDRSIRPLFPDGYKKEVQVIVNVLSLDDENEADMAAVAAVSTALASSSIPWSGPIAAVKVGLVEGEYVVNPTMQQLKVSDMELVVSVTEKAVVMIEAGGNQIPEDKMLGGIEFAQKQAKVLLEFIDDFAKGIGSKKEVVEVKEVDSALEKKIEELTNDSLPKLISEMAVAKAGYSDLDNVKAEVLESVDDEMKSEAARIFEKVFKASVRKAILSGKRLDGRKHDELRKLSSKVGVLPRTHGSGLFQRGQTQALSVATLGAGSLSQLLESAEGEETKRYIHHYAHPPYSVGETGRVGFPGRREIGHGALAEKALLPVIPSEKDFPYTMWVATEILSSNGSTSMASTCGSTLSLMDAGVPLKAPVAGIAMGILVEDTDNYTVLTDIAGIEDGGGDMDFKVAGTAAGITALQLDVKTLMLTSGMLKDAFAQARKARIEILDSMAKAIAKPKAKLSKYAPKIKVITIPQEKIGELIGPGGKVIRQLMADTDSAIDVDNDGSVSISATSEEDLAKAVETVESLTKEVQVGEIYEGKVVRIEAYGAFVNILPNKDGLVHVSRMSEGYVEDPNTVVKMGDVVKVRVSEVDGMGKIGLSMILDPAKEKGKQSSPKGNNRDRSPRRYERSQQRFGGRGRSRRYNDRGGQRKSGGPHFPTSRLVDDRKKYTR